MSQESFNAFLKRAAIGHASPLVRFSSPFSVRYYNNRLMENPSSEQPIQDSLDEAALDQVSGGCAFPAQNIQLQRQVSITNRRPTLVDVKTDACGNVISYTEKMT